MSDPERIYLQPECCADPEYGRLWCEDDEPEDCTDGVPWTEYVLASRIVDIESEAARYRWWRDNIAEDDDIRQVENANP